MHTPPPSTPSLRAARLDDAPVIESIAVAAGMFSAEEVGFIGEQLRAVIEGEQPGAGWLVLEDQGAPIGSAYYAPEPFADRMWNLYFIAVAPEHQSHGHGARMMAHVEETLRALGSEHARTLIVETSSTEQYARTRAFYARIGYAEEARIRQFYGPNDDKVVFWKSLVA